MTAILYSGLQWVLDYILVKVIVASEHCTVSKYISAKIFSSIIHVVHNKSQKVMQYARPNRRR